MFKDRKDGGQKLAVLLSDFKGKDVVVYALPRGGVVTGIEVAGALAAPLDLLVPRKIGHPDNSEYAICAINPEGDTVCAPEGEQLLQTAPVQEIMTHEKQEALRRIHTFLAGRKPLSVKGKTAIIVDDGIATGLTMRAAIISLRHRNPKNIIVAVPVTPDDSAREIEKAGVTVIAYAREQFYAGAVASYYRDFPQVEDEEVVRMLRSQN